MQIIIAFLLARQNLPPRSNGQPEKAPSLGCARRRPEIEVLSAELAERHFHGEKASLEKKDVTKTGQGRNILCTSDVHTFCRVERLFGVQYGNIPLTAQTILTSAPVYFFFDGGELDRKRRIRTAPSKERATALYPSPLFAKAP